MDLAEIVVFLFISLFALPIRAAQPSDIVINEIAWMGTMSSYNDEWIEIYNNTDSEINLSGWKLDAEDGTPKINLDGVISSRSFLLLERTDDTTLPDISADQIYTGALGNEGEKLEIYDISGNLIDSVDCSSGWFAGDNETKQTMERINSNSSGLSPENWQTSQNPEGTPRAKNSEQGIINNEQKTENSKEGSSSPAPLGIKEYPSGIVINEILPSPEGPDETEEWIEVFNRNDFEVDISGWKITDTIGGVKIYVFPAGTILSPKGFLVLSRPTSKITLNNSGDGLKLLRPDEEVADSVIYGKAPQGQAYNRVDIDWAWSNILTPGSENKIPVSEGKEAEPPEGPAGETTLTKGLPDGQELAAAVEQAPRGSIPFALFVTAFSLGISSGITILFLKNKIEKTKELD